LLVGAVLVGVVVGVLVGVVSVEAAGTGVASGAVDGGGVETAAPGGWFEAVVEGETATTTGAVARLSCAGLRPEPTSTPNESSAITATAPADRQGIGRSPSESASCESASTLARDPSGGTTPVSSAIASGSGPCRAPHSTQ
jgi:hypothetical protein